MSDDRRDNPDQLLSELKATVSEKTRRDKTGEPSTSRGNSSQKPDLNNLVENDLVDNERLRSVYFLMCHAGFWRSRSPADVLTFWSIAEKALEEDKQRTPGRLFYGLIKKKDWSKISNEQEARAIARVNSVQRNDIHHSASQIKPVVPKAQIIDEEATHQLYGPIGFHHGVMTQCFMPQVEWPEERPWVRTHGKASLLIDRGYLLTPDSQDESDYQRMQVPFGTKARILMPYIVGYAVQHDTPVIDMGKSLRRFLQGIGISVGGTTGRDFTQQVYNLAAARIHLGFMDDHYVSNEQINIARNVSFWVEKDEIQQSFWKPQMTLSSDFFETLKEHRVPINMEHLVRLSRTARRQDLYVWFSYRMPKLSRPMNMPLATLQAIFGQNIAEPRKFKQKLKGDLKAINAVYGGFNLDLRKDYLEMRPSKHSSSRRPKNGSRAQTLQSTLCRSSPTGSTGCTKASRKPAPLRMLASSKRELPQRSTPKSIDISAQRALG